MKTILLVMLCAISAQAEVVRSVGSLIYKDNVNSRVGINLLNPAYTLDVLGDINYTGAITGSGASMTGVVHSPTESVAQTFSGALTVTSSLTVTGNAFSVGGSTFVVSGGKVGIGTNTPGQELDVQNGKVSLTDSDVAHAITDWVPTNVYGFIEPDHATNGGLRLWGLSDAASQRGAVVFGILGVADPTDTVPAVEFVSAKKSGTSLVGVGNNETVLQVENWGADLMTITGGGNVGIGTASPDSKVSISSSTASTAFISFLGAMTKAEILAFDPVQAGASAYCTDCTVSTICISTGPAASQVADISNRTSACN